MNINVPLPSRVVLRAEGFKSDARNRLPHLCFSCAIKKSLSDERVDVYLVPMCDRYLP